MGSHRLTILLRIQGDMTVEETKDVSPLPCKSLSLRRSSVAKRLVTEQRRSQPKVREKKPKKYRLSKYRRKTENKKERERMKKFNEAFKNLRERLPNNVESIEDDNKSEKKTRVSSLRSAITYINCLQELLEDYDAGRVGEEIFRKSSLLDNRETQEDKKVKKRIKKHKTNDDGNKNENEVMGRWLNDREYFLEQKYKARNCLLNPGSQTQTVITYTTSPSSVQNNPVVSPSSPRDVNEVSLHISILDTCRDSGGDTGTLQYVYAVTQM